MGFYESYHAQLFFCAFQEKKFKYYYNCLSHTVKVHESIMANIRPVVKPLLKPHLDDLEKKIAPGMYSLTWTSMNIDGYLHRAEQAIARFDELVRKINDLVDNRVEANLKCISRAVLVDLPPDRCDILLQLILILFGALSFQSECIFHQERGIVVKYTFYCTHLLSHFFFSFLKLCDFKSCGEHK